MAGGPGLIESRGWAAQGGVGYDVRLGRRFARGPRNPRYLQLGLGFHWY